VHIGYARVSTDDQHCENQIAELRKAGCERIFQENASGGKWDRPEWHKALAQLRKGDVLIVWKLDRLSRSLSDLIWCMNKVRETGADFRSLTENIDTTSACGTFIFHMLGAFAQFERELIKERTKLGLARARALGHKGGNTFLLSVKRQKEIARQVLAGEITQAEAAREERVSQATISRIVVREKAKLLPKVPVGREQ
jgi:DNA invertase Pin-like site-specific DNA recombinase